MKNKLKYGLLVVGSVIVYGFLLPAMISAKSDLLAFGGIALWILYTLLLGKYVFEFLKQKGLI